MKEQEFYKKKIIEMVEAIEGKTMVKFIYGCVRRIYEEQKAGK